jgi:hypothetical protein
MNALQRAQIDAQISNRALRAAIEERIYNLPLHHDRLRALCGAADNFSVTVSNDIARG